MKIILKVSFATLVLLAAVYFVGQQAAATAERYRLDRSQTTDTPVTAWRFFDSATSAESQFISASESVIHFQTAGASQKLDLPPNPLPVQFSQNGKYMAMQSFPRPVEKSPTPGILQIDITDRTGNALYALDQEIHYDQKYPYVAISDFDGAAILGNNSEGILRFFNNSGQLLREVQLFSDASYSMERIMGIDISADGSRVAVIAGKRGASSAQSAVPNPSGDPHLFLFTNSGEELWRQPLPDYSASNVIISGNAETIIVGTYTAGLPEGFRKRSFLFDPQGAQIAEIPMLLKQARFSSDANTALLWNNQDIRSINTVDGTENWQQSISRSEGMLCAAALSEDGSRIAFLIGRNKHGRNGFMFSEPLLRVVDQSGKILQEISMPEQQFKTPALFLSPNASQIRIGFLDTYQIYQEIQ